MKKIFLIAQVLTLFLSTARANTQDFQDQFSKSITLMTKNFVTDNNNWFTGAIIAAPSKHDPDYYYHWVRDAALTVEATLDLYEGGYLNVDQRQQVRSFLVQHINYNQIIHHNALLGQGLGEPKFLIEGPVYPLPWGRPQNDGPALRALTFNRILQLAVKEKWPQLDLIKKIIYETKLPTNSLMKSDLEYVAHHWQDLNFDLWEEVYGSHFYTLMTQRKSLTVGIQTAQSFSDSGAAQFYQQELQKVNAELEKFWKPQNKFILATLNSSNQNKSHLDVAVVLAVLHSNIDNASFSFDDDRVIATFQKLKDQFSAIYTVNKNTNYGTALGRYPEDTYNGYSTDGQGNPWVLATAAAAEFLYRSATQLAQKESVEITQANQKFYNQTTRARNLRVGQIIQKKNPKFKQLIQNMITEADGYLARIIFHRNADGSLSEQINRNSGFMQGAVNLTWSHASFLTAKMSRDHAMVSLKKLKGSL